MYNFVQLSPSPINWENWGKMSVFLCSLRRVILEGDTISYCSALALNPWKYQPFVLWLWLIKGFSIRHTKFGSIYCSFELSWSLIPSSNLILKDKAKIRLSTATALSTPPYYLSPPPCLAYEGVKLDLGWAQSVTIIPLYSHTQIVFSKYPLFEYEYRFFPSWI